MSWEGPGDRPEASLPSRFGDAVGGIVRITSDPPGDGIRVISGKAV